MKKTLKIMTMLLCFVSIAALSSCKKDYSDNIIGKWKVTHYYEIYSTSPDRQRYVDDWKDYIIEFTEYESILTDTDGEKEMIEYAIDGDSISFFFWGEEMGKGVIEECTNSSLKYNYSEEDDWSDTYKIITHYVECESAE